MAQIHEPGEAWHIGWDQAVRMWFVEPPFDVELDDPIIWYEDRDRAFAFVDKQIREQPVQASLVDEHLIDSSSIVDATPQSDIPPALAKALQRQRNNPEPVREPVRQYANDDAASRVADYQQMVGLQ